MPSSLTTAGLRWIRIAEKHVDRDSTAIFKLCTFVEKIKADDREFDRLVREADLAGHDRELIADAGSVSATTLESLLDSPLDDANRPRETRKRNQPKVLTQLRKFTPAACDRRERLEWWVDKAVKDGWSVEDTAAAAGMTIADVERIAADVLKRRREREAQRCSFCGKDKDEISVYCKHSHAHDLPFDAKVGREQLEESAQYVPKRSSG